MVSKPLFGFGLMHHVKYSTDATFSIFFPRGVYFN